MNPHPALPWQSLFPASATPGGKQERKLHLLSKHGEPLLLLPIAHRAAVEGLSLYPAQTAKARIARKMLGTLLRFGLAPGTQPATVDLDPASAFVRFLREVGGGDEFDFALLMGNPRAPGRRFICLVFDQTGQPRAIVKAGTHPTARELIRRELDFLRSTAPELSTGPAVKGTLIEPELAAIALEYVPGPNPSSGNLGHAAALLESWLDHNTQVTLAELPAIKRLAASLPPDSPGHRLLIELAAVKCHPTLHHGDFAPWNIRVDARTGRWRVLDWERGEPSGPPAWDWFHFVLQPAVLVQHAAGPQLQANVGQLLRAPAFEQYARKAGVADHTRQLLLAYLHHCRQVIQQTEGLNRIEQLLESLATR